MCRDIFEAADDLDSEIDRMHALRMIAHEARRHGYRARVTAGHVLVIGLDGACLATRSARRLAAWMGY